MEGLFDLEFRGELIDLFRMLVVILLVFIGFALTDWGKDDD